MLERTDPKAIWIPDGMDWDGLNDRLAIVPRRWASAYFGRLPNLLNGSLVFQLSYQLKERVTSERLLLLALHLAGAPVRRFSSTCAVLCQPGINYGHSWAVIKCSRMYFLGWRFK